MKIPFLATSIIPLEKSVPTRIPILATMRIVFHEATLEPIAEFRKLTASLATPTIRSRIANRKRRIRIHWKRLMCKKSILVFVRKNKKTTSQKRHSIG